MSECDCNCMVRDGLPKKIAVLLDFVQMRGGRALPKFFVHFSQTVYRVNLGMRREGETPAKILLAHWRSKKLVQVVQIGGRGWGRGNLDKIQKNSYFFW